ncbi:hypothetical protein B7494_g5263 [Chlorociboria aeruginascens]|nr:hypothetical protein B7494_g5263 [Chlorociboria aeruginascens]
MALNYNPDKDIPNLAGKVILITGGTAGIGRTTITELAKHNPKHIYFTGRKVQAAESLIAETKTTSPNLTFIPCDQTSLQSVSLAAKQFLKMSGNQLDILICNAGVMAVPPSVSKDGYEIQFAINYISHALLIKLCLPALLKAASERGDARIVSLSSLAFRSAPPEGIRFKDIKHPENSGFMIKWLRYGQSKLANILYASQLSNRYPSLTVAAVHPGIIEESALQSHLSMLDCAVAKLATLKQPRIGLLEGAFNTLWAATTTDKKALVSGGMYGPVGKPLPPTKQSKDEALAEELWDWTEKELASYS